MTAVATFMPTVGQAREAGFFPSRHTVEIVDNRMLADGVTLIIRGQRADDSHKAPVQSGDWELGSQYLFPIEQWSDEDVDGYLAKVGAPRNRCYDYVKSQPDCMNCSGWWSDNRAPFLKACYPEAHDEYQRRLDLIRDNTSLLIAQFNIECGGE